MQLNHYHKNYKKTYNLKSSVWPEFEDFRIWLYHKDGRQIPSKLVPYLLQRDNVFITLIEHNREVKFVRWTIDNNGGFNSFKTKDGRYLSQIYEHYLINKLCWEN